MLYSPILPERIAETVHPGFDWHDSSALERVLDMQEALTLSINNPSENYDAFQSMIETQDTDMWVHVLHGAMIDRGEYMRGSYSVDFSIPSDFSYTRVIAESVVGELGQYEKPQITFHVFEESGEYNTAKYHEIGVYSGEVPIYHKDSLEMLLVKHGITELIDHSLEDQDRLAEALQIYKEAIQDHLT